MSRWGADTLKEHLAGILCWFKSGLANGLLEGINSMLQAAKSKARGYRTIRNLITMAYLIAGTLDLLSGILQRSEHGGRRRNGFNLSSNRLLNWFQPWLTVLKGIW